MAASDEDCDELMRHDNVLESEYLARHVDISSCLRSQFEVAAGSQVARSCELSAEGEQEKLCGRLKE